MFRLVKRRMALEWEHTLFVRLAIGAALAVLLLESFMQRLLGQLRNVVLARGGDLIVTQAGVADFVASRSALPQSSRAATEVINGVDTAHPMALVPVIYQRGGFLSRRVLGRGSQGVLPAESQRLLLPPATRRLISS